VYRDLCGTRRSRVAALRRFDRIMQSREDNGCTWRLCGSRVAQTATNGRVRAEKPLPLPSSTSISLFDDRAAKVSRLTQTRLSRRLPTRVTIAIARIAYRSYLARDLDIPLTNYANCRLPASSRRARARARERERANGRFFNADFTDSRFRRGIEEGEVEEGGGWIAFH